MPDNDEVLPQEPTAKNEATETEVEAKAETEVNDLFKDLEEPESGEEGTKSHRIPYSRFKEVLVKRDEAEQKASGLQTELEEMEGVLEDVNKLYGDFQKPYEQMRLDAQFMSILDKYRDDPDVAPAVAKVMDILQKGGPTEKPVRGSKKATEPTLDTNVVSNVSGRTEAILEKANVRSELIPLLIEDVLRSKSLEAGISDAEILDLVKAKVKARNWSAEFLRNTSTKSSTKAKAIPEFKGKSPEPKKESKPATTEEWSERNRARALETLRRLQEGGE